MALAAGTRIGACEIVTLIGAGGMGEVYRARDTRLKRDVALKVLPEAFARDPERMARFEREATVLASLNHPHIATLYGLEENALVMELVEGQTLPGPLPVETALSYAKQIAEALEYAHERGVVHRDLKPANVKVTPEGTVKLLDFGLAKAVEDPGPGEDASESPTLTLGHTRMGAMLGTPAYMSPEQASGRKADRRADIWSFGAVLYEMLTGKRAFEGESVSDTLATVLKLDPDWMALPRETPGAIRGLLERCLTKDRKQRLQAIGEARIVLEGPVGQVPDLPAQAGNLRHTRLPWAVAAVLAVALAVALWMLWPPRTADRPLVRLDVDLGSDVALFSGTAGGGSSVIISPDGTRLAYLASVGGGPRKLYTRRLDQPAATELPGTSGAIGPFFSPDGQWIGFLAGQKVNKISVEGGAAVPLNEVAGIGNGANARWSADGILLSRPLAGLERIPSGGGTVTALSELANGEFFHGQPQVLPGGKAVLFAAYPAPDAARAGIDVISLADHRRKTVAPRGVSPRYVPSGHLLYMNSGTLFAVRFDLDRLETRGAAVPVADGIGAAGGLREAGHFDVSDSGTLVYIKGSFAGGLPMSTVQWVDSTGKQQPLASKQAVYYRPRLSPDGKRLAAAVYEGGNQDIQVYDMEREAWTKLTFGGGPYSYPVWSPDGRYVVFGESPGGVSSARSDGAGQPVPLMQSKLSQNPGSFYPGGKRVAFVQYEANANAQIWTMALDEEGGQLKAGEPEQFLQSQFINSSPAFSPDGRWLAYQSNESSGMYEVYVRPFPPPAGGKGGKWQISNKGGIYPLWSRTSHELLYQAGDQEMAVSYTVKGDTFLPEKPRVWAAKVGGTAYDLSPDGKRLVVLAPAGSPEGPKAEHEVVFLQNFFDELRRRAPVGE